MRYENCQFCGKLLINKAKELSSQGWKDVEFIFDMGYCDILHRKSHERLLIKEGKMEDIESLSKFAVMKDTKYRDSNGEMVWFPLDGKPYFDKALQQTFNSKAEKVRYMKEKNIVMDGSSDKLNRGGIPEAGDSRHLKVR